MTTWEHSLLADLRFEADQESSEETLTSIFFGGGTPSLMPTALVAALLSEAEKIWGFAPDIEITLEANPSSVEAANFAALASAGVNRVSLGVQSLSDEALRFLGRLHDTEEAYTAVETAHKHFERTSIDLIYARPGQSGTDWSTELGEALAMGVDHLSLYQLTIEPATRFATDVRRGIFNPLDDDRSADLFALTREMTDAAGLPAYEISNHARPGQESGHNLTYWRYQDYIGIGPGAHGRRGGVATVRHRKPENYLAAVKERRHGVAEARELGGSEMASEALLMGLRLAEGLDLHVLGRRFGVTPSALINDGKLALYRDLGLVWQADQRIGVTPQGMPLLDALLGELVCGELVTS